jgi:hypothetical protein
MTVTSQSPSYQADIASAAALIADLAQARTCYDHLAGRAGVELLDAMLRRDLLEENLPAERTT